MSEQLSLNTHTLQEIKRCFDHAAKNTAIGRKIPMETLAVLRRYVVDGLKPGHFLTAVMSNDLFGAVSHAVGDNRDVLADIVTFLHSYCPGACYGSSYHCERWLNADRETK